MVGSSWDLPRVNLEKGTWCWLIQKVLLISYYFMFLSTELLVQIQMEMSRHFNDMWVSPQWPRRSLMVRPFFKEVAPPTVQLEEKASDPAPDESWDGSLAVIEKSFWHYINSASVMVRRALEKCRKAGVRVKIARLNQLLMIEAKHLATIMVGYYMLCCSGVVWHSCLALF